MSLSSSLNACFAFSRLLQLRPDLSASGLASSSSCGSRRCPVELERRRDSATVPRVLTVASALHSQPFTVLFLLPRKPFRGQARLLTCPSRASKENEDGEFEAAMKGGSPYLLGPSSRCRKPCSRGWAASSTSQSSLRPGSGSRRAMGTGMGPGGIGGGSGCG